MKPNPTLGSEYRPDDALREGFVCAGRPGHGAALQPIMVARPLRYKRGSVPGLHG